LRLDSTASLPDGRRARLRYPQAADREGIAALHARLGVRADDVELARTLRFDPRTRLVLCATTWVDGHEIVVAWAAAARGHAIAHTILADETLAPGVGALVRSALAARARAAA